MNFSQSVVCSSTSSLSHSPSSIVIPLSELFEGERQEMERERDSFIRQMESKAGVYMERGRLMVEEEDEEEEEEKEKDESINFRSTLESTQDGGVGIGNRPKSDVVDLIEADEKMKQ